MRRVFALDGPNPLPEFVVDYAQCRNIGDDPFVFRVEPRAAFTSLRVFDEPLAVIGNATQIKFIV
ncbi:MAG: hypothetical protein HOF30_06920 [Rhodospirillaceae bacterium]|nr:hypothetical protein [Rhodospirillaceae bacterium]MBT5035355.1 hypothetical protein [Rhodospirillaceae bacterium]MBT7771888.1 hypothetical protein [Rhodospirillales bacterium]